MGSDTFTQFIDHNNHSLGTFSQRYWWNAEFWGGPGSPVVLFNAGEFDAAPYVGYLSENAITGAHAKAVDGAIIMVEHRGYGASTPFAEQDTANLQYLSLENAIQDMVHFARDVELPFDTNRSSNAPESPWVFVGASYTGALAAWIQKLAPGTFWAYHSSSGPVQAIYNFWHYYVPVQKGMPQDCRRAFEQISSQVDKVLGNGTATDVSRLKAMFELETLEHNDDFANAISSPLGGWQSTGSATGDESFQAMCDSILGLGGSGGGPAARSKPTAEGVGGVGVLNSYANWFKTQYVKNACSGFKYPEWEVEGSVGCFDTHNASSPFYRDWTANNTAHRPWMWQLCDEPFFYWPTGSAPEGVATIVPRAITPEYYQQQCDLFFPEQGNHTYGSDDGATDLQLNQLTGGWNLTNTTRLLWINGEFDPWRSASVSSDFRPGGPLQSTPEAPVFVMSGARHCEDMQIRNNVNPAVGEAQEAATAQIQTWVAEFYAQGNGKITVGREKVR
ncbi:hypothetical protein RB595_008590 [Gaeumannomyces hyphopodioides]